MENKTKHLPIECLEGTIIINSVLVEGLGKKPVKMVKWGTEIGVPVLTFRIAPNVSANTAWTFDKNYWAVETMDFAVLLCMRAVIYKHSCLCKTMYEGMTLGNNSQKAKSVWSRGRTNL